MSDVLLTRIATALEGLLEHAKTGAVKVEKAVVAGAKEAVASAKEAVKEVAGAKAVAAAPKPGAKAAAAAAASTPPKGTTAPPAGVAGKPAPAQGDPNKKGASGKYSEVDVRDMIRQVATTPGLGKVEATTILDEEGGVQNVSALKQDKYDAVIEACKVALAGKAPAAATEVDDADPCA